MSYQVFALKWRPQRFGDVAGQAHISRTLANALRTGRTAHAYLFTGPRGVGKTSMARILAKAVNCENRGDDGEPCGGCASCVDITSGRAIDVIEIDGASNRGIDDIRELRERVRYAPARLSNKIYIIDEVHMLTSDAFNALLKTLEEPPPHVVFVLATTEPLKVPQTILSRCQRFDFARLRARDVVAQLETICESEGLETDTDALTLIANKGEGSMRDALTLLDQVVATGSGPLTAEVIRDALGIMGRELYFEWGEAIRERDAARALLALGRAIDEGANLQELAEEFLVHLRHLLAAATDPALRDTIEATDEERDRFLEQAADLVSVDLLRFCRIAIDAVAQMRRSGYPRVHLEVALAEMCSLPTAVELKKFIEVAKTRFPESAGEPVPSSRARETERASQSPPRPGSTATGARIESAEAAPEQATAPAKQEGPTPRNGSAIDLVAGWNAVLAAIEKEKPALGGFLVGSAPREVEGHLIHVDVPGLDSFRAGLLRGKSNAPVIEHAVESTFGRSLKVEFHSAPGERPSAPARRDADMGSGKARIQKIVEFFDGDVIGPS